MKSEFQLEPGPCCSYEFRLRRQPKNRKDPWKQTLEKELGSDLLTVAPPFFLSAFFMEELLVSDC